MALEKRLRSEGRESSCSNIRFFLLFLSIFRLFECYEGAVSPTFANNCGLWPFVKASTRGRSRSAHEAGITHGAGGHPCVGHFFILKTLIGRTHQRDPSRIVGGEIREKYTYAGNATALQKNKNTQSPRVEKMTSTYYFPIHKVTL